MTLRISDLQSDSDLDSIHNSCDVSHKSNIALICLCPKCREAFEACKRNLKSDFSQLNQNHLCICEIRDGVICIACVGNDNVRKIQNEVLPLNIGDDHIWCTLYTVHGVLAILLADDHIRCSFIWCNFNTFVCQGLVGLLVSSWINQSEFRSFSRSNNLIHLILFNDNILYRDLKDNPLYWET